MTTAAERREEEEKQARKDERAADKAAADKTAAEKEATDKTATEKKEAKAPVIPTGLNSPWRTYEKRKTTEMRPWVKGEDMKNIIVDSKQGTPEPGGWIARNSDNHLDQWYMSEEYVRIHYVYQPTAVGQAEPLRRAADRVAGKRELVQEHAGDPGNRDHFMGKGNKDHFMDHGHDANREHRGSDREGNREHNEAGNRFI